MGSKAPQFRPQANQPQTFVAESGETFGANGCRPTETGERRGQNSPPPKPTNVSVPATAAPPPKKK
jgi:hypothetical protein